MKTKYIYNYINPDQYIYIWHFSSFFPCFWSSSDEKLRYSQAGAAAPGAQAAQAPAPFNGRKDGKNGKSKGLLARKCDGNFVIFSDLSILGVFTFLYFS